MKIIEKDIKELIPYEFNNKIHDEKQINRIANSINEFGFTQPVVVDGNNILIIGHGRLEAAKKLGLKKIPTVVMEDLTENQIKRLRILDNKLNESERDIDNLKLELEAIDDQELWDMFEGFGEDVLDFENDKTYTKKIEPPIYEPADRKPEIKELYDNEKQKKLEDEIKKSDLPEEVKDFLIKASYRHIEFNYKLIADFYSNSSKEIQDLMEKSALVIIDYNKAIENGYVIMSENLLDLAFNDKGDGES